MEFKLKTLVGNVASFVLLIALLSGCASKHEIAYTWIARPDCSIPFGCYVNTEKCEIALAAVHNSRRRSSGLGDCVAILFVTDREIGQLWPPRFGTRRSSHVSVGVCAVRLLLASPEKPDNSGHESLTQQWFKGLQFATAKDSPGAAEFAWLNKLRDDMHEFSSRRTSQEGQHESQPDEDQREGQSEPSESAAAHVSNVQTSPTDCEEDRETQPGETLCEEKRFFVYIHGYNNSFEEAAKTCAAFVSELKTKLPLLPSDDPGSRIEPIPILFSWTSATNPFAYLGDAERATLAAPALAQLLDTLIGLGARVDVFAHSMGAQVLMEALQIVEFPDKFPDKPDKRRLEQVILAAPDVNREHFLHLYGERLNDSASRVTIYVDNRDTTLWLSSFLRAVSLKFFDRVGSTSPFGGDPVVVRRGRNKMKATFDTVHVGELWSRYPNRHGYVHRHFDYIRDVRKVLADVPVGDSRRSLTRCDIEPHRWLSYWKLRPIPKDRRKRPAASSK